MARSRCRRRKTEGSAVGRMVANTFTCVIFASLLFLGQGKVRLFVMSKRRWIHLNVCLVEFQIWPRARIRFRLTVFVPPFLCGRKTVSHIAAASGIADIRYL